MTENAAARERLALPVDRAVEVKFAEGRALYGREWQGDRPAIEGHDDALDVVAYIQEEQLRHGDNPELRRAKRIFLHGLEVLRGYIERQLE